MNNIDKLKENKKSYSKAEVEAQEYYNYLKSFVNNSECYSKLISELRVWRKKHRKTNIVSSIIYSEKRKPKTNEYTKYISYLEKSGLLENYLDRSITYIYMRDLGKDLSNKETRESISKSVNQLMTSMTSGKNLEQGLNKDLRVSFYKKAKDEEIELTVIWLFEKLKKVADNIPKEMSYEHAQRKLIKIILGVVMHETELMDDSISRVEKKMRLEKAIKLGYAYGLTYPFIDDLLDVNVLNSDEEQRYSNIIKEALTTGEVPCFGAWEGKNKELMKFIQEELKEAFLYIKDNQPQKTFEAFLNQAYVFFKAQEIDRIKKLNNKDYSSDDIFIPVILKSSFSRLIARSITGADSDFEFDKRTLYYGIYNQLSDDFSDMFDDLEDESVTPYTYYLKYKKDNKDLINPFKLYWVVIYNLVKHVYKDDEKMKDVLFSRAINGLKRFKGRWGEEKFKGVMKELLGDYPEFLKEINIQVHKARNVDFLDKLLRDNIAENIKDNKCEVESFKTKIDDIKNYINELIILPENEDINIVDDIVMSAANYSLKGEGKRLRPVISYCIGVDEFNIKKEILEQILKTLEYMHTASLIFDDLPSQDNATMRRGKETLHKVYNVGISELTGVYLTQRAIREQTLLLNIDKDKIVKLINYSCKTTEDMCKGQVLDLTSKGKSLKLEELNNLCFYKTGLAFEASLIMPSILAGISEEKIKLFKKFSYHTGIMFQIKDDILDVEGDSETLGKNIGKDEENCSTTFVSVLGIEGAKQEMWNHYISAYDTLQELNLKTNFLKLLLDYIINRSK